MKKLMMKLSSIPALALVLVLWSCTDLAEPTRLMGPGEVATSTTADGVKYKVAKGVYNEKTRKESKIIDGRGGSLGIAGNVLIVPNGAVSQPTLFEMKLASVDSLGYTPNKVELRAYVQDVEGKYKIDVGANGFLVPLKLRLTYEWITDPIAPENFRIVWLKNVEGDQEVYSTTMDASGRTISTFLDHFSDYAIGFPDAL